MCFLLLLFCFVFVYFVFLVAVFFLVSCLFVCLFVFFSFFLFYTAEMTSLSWSQLLSSVKSEHRVSKNCSMHLDVSVISFNVYFVEKFHLFKSLIFFK